MVPVWIYMYNLIFSSVLDHTNGFFHLILIHVVLSSNGFFHLMLTYDTEARLHRCPPWPASRPADSRRCCIAPWGELGRRHKPTLEREYTARVYSPNTPPITPLNNLLTHVYHGVYLGAFDTDESVIRETFQSGGYG